MASMQSDRIADAVAKRQKVLDFALVNPFCTIGMVADVLGLAIMPTRRVLSDMVAMGELKQTGKRCHIRYQATKDVTLAEDVIRARLSSCKAAPGRPSSERSKEVEEPKARPGVITNSSNKPANKSSGGQGAALWATCFKW